MKKIKYRIEGLDCPNCALKVQNHLSKNENINNCEIDFLNQKMIIEYKNKELDHDSLMTAIKEVEEDDINISYFKNNNKEKKIINKKIIILISRIVLSLIILLFNALYFSKLSSEKFDVFYWISLIIYILNYLLISYDYLIKFIKNFKSIKSIFNEVSLMVVASIGAFCIQEFNEAILVILLSQVGEIFEEISINRSKRVIVNTIDTRSKKATKILQDGSIEEINCDDIKINDLLKIKKVIYDLVHGQQ